MKRLFVFVSVVIATIATFGFYFTNRLMFIKKKDEKFVIEREKAAGRFIPSDFNALPQKRVTIQSPHGYPLQAILLEPHQTNRYIIFCHGVTENKMNSIKYMNLFLKRGFNALIYDHRRHGESGGTTTSYGYYEKDDLKAVVDWLKNARPDIHLGIHGESMGAVTMLLYAGMIEDGADFYIADCPFSSLEEQIAYRLKEDMKLPPRLFLPLANFFLQLRDGYHLKHVTPVAVIKNIVKPVLFIHSNKDTFILPEMTTTLFNEKPGYKKLFMAVNGAHAQSLIENQQAYEEAIDDFLKNIETIA